MQRTYLFHFRYILQQATPEAWDWRKRKSGKMIWMREKRELWTMECATADVVLLIRTTRTMIELGTEGSIEVMQTTVKRLVLVEIPVVMRSHYCDVGRHTRR